MVYFSIDAEKTADCCVYRCIIIGYTLPANFMAEEGQEIIYIKFKERCAPVC